MREDLGTQNGWSFLNPKLISPIRNKLAFTKWKWFKQLCTTDKMFIVHNLSTEPCYKISDLSLHRWSCIINKILSRKCTVCSGLLSWQPKIGYTHFFLVFFPISTFPPSSSNFAELMCIIQAAITCTIVETTFTGNNLITNNFGSACYCCLLFPGIQN